MRKLLFAVLTLALSVAPFVASAQSKDITREEWYKIKDDRHENKLYPIKGARHSCFENDMFHGLIYLPTI